VSEAIASGSVVHALARARAECTAEGYELLASAFEVANNLSTAAVFQKLGEECWAFVKSLPATTVKPPPLKEWTQPSGEISDADAVHYMMPPWYAFDLAHRHEKASVELLEALTGSSNAEVSRAAAEVARLWQPRAEAMVASRDQQEKPPRGWWVDEDGPNKQGD
jgi:hypothetical protein